MEKWREVVIFFISEPMSTTQPPACTMSTDRSRRSSRRLSKRNSNEEEVLVVSKHLFTSKSSTCFTFGLNPANEAHKNDLCDGCVKVLSGRGGMLTKEIREAKRDSVGINKQCHQPWHPKYAEHREHGKMVRYNDFSATRGKELQMKVLSDYLLTFPRQPPFKSRLLFPLFSPILWMQLKFDVNFCNSQRTPYDAVNDAQHLYHH